MKIDDFDRTKMQWDRYRRFHTIGSHGSVKFETGEMIFTHSVFKPDSRCGTRDNVAGASLRIVGTNDRDCPPLYFHAETLSTDEARADLAKLNQKAEDMSGAVPKAWLNGSGRQMLLVDSETGRAIGMGPNGAHKAWAHTPDWIKKGVNYYQSAVVYIPGNNKNAIGSNVALFIPYKRTTEQRRAEAELVGACKAWDTIAGGNTKEVAPKYYEYSRLKNGMGGYPYCRPYPVNYLHGESAPDFPDLRPEQIVQIARHGIETPRLTAKVTSLTTNPTKGN
jgi:hypothetical protein